MSEHYDAYDADRPLLLRCACGQDHAPGAHTQAPASEQSLSHSFMEASLVKALFPADRVRRGFLKAVGANTARAAIASLLPIQALQAMAQDAGADRPADLPLVRTRQRVRHHDQGVDPRGVRRRHPECDR